MKKANTRKIISAALAMTLFGSVVNAGTLKIDFSKNITEGTLTVETTSLKDDVVTVQVLPQTITPQQIAQNTLLGEQTEYVRNKVAGENGKVTFTFSVDPGDYTLYVASSESSERYYEESFNYVDGATYAILIGQLGQKNKDDFLNTVKSGNNLAQLGFNVDICSDEAIKRYYDEYVNELSETDYEQNLNNFKKCAIIEALNANSNADILKYIEQAYKNDTELLSSLDKNIKSTEIEEYFVKRMRSESSNAIKDSADLTNTIKKALVLTIVRYPLEANNIKLAMDEYKDVLGLSRISSYSSVYRGLSNKDYKTTKELLNAYNTLVREASGSGSSGGSGGSSGGGSSITPSGGSSNPIGIPSTAGQTQDMKIFNDIEDVAWAKDSIEVLYKEGIVSGKGDQKFYPQDNISREEFVKMLIATFDIKLVGEDVPFLDVSRDAWYYDYVKTAYIAGVVSGVTETEFGTGRKITRQDICAMTYRMLNECDIQIPVIKEEVQFGDVGAISDYAKEAITALQKAGIVNGNDAGNFNPKATATRAETAKIMHGVLNLIGRG